MNTTQLLTNPVYHWYPANIYHKTFNRQSSVSDDGYTHKSPAPATTNVCRLCGQPIVSVESNPQPDSLHTRQQIVGAVVVSVMMLVLLIVGVNKLFER